MTRLLINEAFSSKLAVEGMPESASLAEALRRCPGEATRLVIPSSGLLGLGGDNGGVVSA